MSKMDSFEHCSILVSVYGIHKKPMEKEQEDNNDIPEKFLYSDGAIKIEKIDEIYSYLDHKDTCKSPGLVLAVVGDSESFVPKPWNTTAFTNGLRKTVQGAKRSWIIYRGAGDGVSEYITSEFGPNNTQNCSAGYMEEDQSRCSSSSCFCKRDTTKESTVTKYTDDTHVTLIGIQPTTPESQNLSNSNQGIEEKRSYFFLLEPRFQNVHMKYKEFRWFNKYLSQLLVHISKSTTPLLSIKTSETNTNTEVSMKIPVLLILVEGDIKTIHQVKSALNNNIPVLIIKGSGKAADLIADYLQNSNKDEFLKNKAPLLLGLHFLKDEFELLKKEMENIQELSYLVTVYNIDCQDGSKLEESVVEAIIKGWSMQNFNTKAIKEKKRNDSYSDVEPVEPEKTDKNPDCTEGENIPERKKARTVTCNIINDSKLGGSLMEHYQLELKPGSLSLYFYIAYQYIQEKQDSKKKKESIDMQLLLLEAIIADREEYVSAMLQNGVSFNQNHFEKLYNETFICDTCEGKDCRKIHSVHFRICSDTCKMLWCTCKLKETDGKIGACERKIFECRVPGCSKHHEYCSDEILLDTDGDGLADCYCCTKRGKVNPEKETCNCLRHKRISRNDTNEYECVDIRVAGRHICQNLLNYSKVKKADSSLTGDATDQSKRKGTVFHDLLAWALLENRVEMAGVFWARCDHQLLTAIMASSILKNMAECVENAKDRKLFDELMAHSKLFEDRVISMQNALYEEHQLEIMSLMDRKAKVWDIEISPMTCAFENNMVDVIGHPCVQRYLNRIWYNESWQCLTESNFSSATTKWRDWAKDVFCCHSGKSILRSWTSPLMVFVLHYIFAFIAIVGFSAVIMTELRVIESYRDIFIVEWLLYVWLAADLIEEIFVRQTVNQQYLRPNRSKFFFSIKRLLTNFWNFATAFSYMTIAVAIFMRCINADDFYRMTMRLYSLGMFTLVVRYLQFMLVNKYLGPKIIMIGKMLVELLKFSWILIIFVLCTGVLYHGNMFPYHSNMWADGAENWRLWKILSLPYWQIYGELFLEELEGKNNEENVTCTFSREEWKNNPNLDRCVEYDWVLISIAAVYMLITNLLLVNLIIALFTYRFEEVQINSDRLWKFDRYSMIINFRHRYPVPFNLIFRIIYMYKICCSNESKMSCCCTAQQKGQRSLLVKEQCVHAVKRLFDERQKTY